MQDFKKKLNYINSDAKWKPNIRRSDGLSVGKTTLDSERYQGHEK